MAREAWGVNLKVNVDGLDEIKNLSNTFTDEKIEKFLRGEGELESRTMFNIDERGWVERKSQEDGSTSNFLRIKGVATTSAVDDNGVEIVASALRTLPKDFEDRNTVLFNHNTDFPIGKVVSSRYVNGRSGSPSRVEVIVDIDPEQPATNGQPVGRLIENDIVSKFSFAWSTKRGEIVVEKTKEEKEEEKDDNIAYSFKFGSDYAPRILIYALRAVELSTVTVPADADSVFGTAAFSRSLGSYLERHQNEWTRNESGLVVPVQPVRVIRKMEPRIIKRSTEGDTI